MKTLEEVKQEVLSKAQQNCKIIVGRTLSIKTPKHGKNSSFTGKIIKAEPDVRIRDRSVIGGYNLVIEGPTGRRESVRVETLRSLK